MAAADALSIEHLRRMARRRLPRFAFEFIDGGADDEVTLRRNRAAFEEIVFRPRVAVDVSKRTLATTLLGGPAAMPMAISPTGMAAIAWPEGEVGLARAAKKHAIPFTLSTQSSFTIERVAEVGGRLWFQLYHFRDRDLVAGLVQRAFDAGYEAMVVTLDVPVPANREKDRRNRFGMPLQVTPRMAFEVATHPAWALDLLRHGIPNSANVPRAPLFQSSATPAAPGAIIDASLTWTDIARLRDLWPRPLLVKGVLTGEDAAKAVEIGLDGMVVSNHGGRQLDGAPATVEALPEVVEGAAGKAEVFIDSGVRRGSDVVKALALGARGALVGRPTLFGLAAGGQAGAEHALTLLRADIHRTLAFIGCPDVGALGPQHVRRPR